MAGNVFVACSQLLANSGCTPDTSDARLFVPSTGRYTYADVVMSCGEEVHQDDALDTLLTPTLIVDVISPSTEAYDRGKKFQQYRSIPSFSEYLLIAQDEILVEHHVREVQEWKSRFYQDLSAEIPLQRSGIKLPLSAVYHGVKF